MNDDGPFGPVPVPDCPRCRDRGVEIASEGSGPCPACPKGREESLQRTHDKHHDTPTSRPNPEDPPPEYW